MKCLLVTQRWGENTHHSASSGYQRIAQYISKYCDIDVMTFKFWKVQTPISNPPTIYALTPPRDFLLERRLTLSMHAFLKRKKYCLIHCLYEIPAFFPVFSSTPTIVTAHVTQELDRSLRMRYNSFFQKQIFKRAAAVICVSRNLKKIIEQNYNVKKVYYVPHGIDTKVFRPFKKDPKLRSRLLGRKYKKICLIVGSYGTHEAVIQGLADYMKSTLFVRVNKNIEAQHIKNILYVSNLSEKELLNMYNVADIFFRPLNFATANNSILEAMTMQKIIVTSNVGGIREYLNNKSAYLVKDNNFKSAFEQILNNWQRAKSKAKEARRKAVKHFSWEIIAKKTYEIYKKVYNENTFHT